MNHLKNFIFNKYYKGTILSFTALYFISKSYKFRKFYLEENLASTVIIKGEYENKIRIFSPIEKRYCIFGKIDSSEKQMNYFDFFESLIPFQNIQNKKHDDTVSSLSSINEFNEVLNKIDVDEDKNISFEEYLTLCFIASSKYTLILAHINKFKVDLCDKESEIIESEKLKSYMSSKISSLANLKQSKKINFLESRIVSTNEETVKKQIDLFVNKAFNNSQNIELKELNSLKFKLFMLLQYYEFYRIKDVQNDSISMQNFAKIFVSYINIYKNKMIKEKIANKEYKLDGEITFNEFISFFWFVNEFSELKEKLKNKSFSKEEFTNFANEKLLNFPDNHKRTKINSKIVDLVYDILDKDSKLIINQLFRKRKFGF